MLQAVWQGGGDLSIPGLALSSSSVHEVLAVVMTNGRVLWAYYGQSSETDLDGPDIEERDRQRARSELRLVGACDGPTF